MAGGERSGGCEGLTTPMMMSAERAPSFPTAALMPCAMPRYSVGNSSEA